MTPQFPGAEAQPVLDRSLTWWQSDLVKRTLGVAVVIAITLFSFWLALHPSLVVGLGQWGYVGAFVISLIASATIVLPAPGLAIIIAMGTALNPVTLGLVAGVGSAFGELTGYFAGATGSALIPEQQRHHFDRIHALTVRYGPFLLALLAAIPFPLFDFAGIVAGILRMRVATFIVAVAIGKSIKYVILILISTQSIQLLLHWLR